MLSLGISSLAFLSLTVSRESLSHFEKNEIAVSGDGGAEELLEAAAAELFLEVPVDDMMLLADFRAVLRLGRSFDDEASRLLYLLCCYFHSTLEQFVLEYGCHLCRRVTGQKAVLDNGDDLLVGKVSGWLDVTPSPRSCPAGYAVDN